MYNFQTKESEPIDVDPILGVGDYPWEDFGKGSISTRTDNHNLQTFSIKLVSVNNYNNNHKRQTIGLSCRAKTNSRQARTEIQPSGLFLCNSNGLQWYLLKCDYATKDITGNQWGSAYHRGARTNGEAWNGNGYRERTDFKPGSRIYLIAIDAVRAYPNQVYRKDNYNTWGIVADNVTKINTNDKDVLISTGKNGSEGLIITYVSKAKGLDYIMANRIWNMLEATMQSQITDEEFEMITNWTSNKLERDIEDYDLAMKARKEVKDLEIDPLRVKYAQQFKNAEEILRVGHLRFARVSDANIQKSGNSVIDLIEWYGIIPVLNVPKTVVFDCNEQYFTYHSNAVCGLCVNDNLELPSGRYVIDIDSHCFYYHSNYKYKYSKKAWILSSLANMSVTIDNSVIDRIIPIGADGVKITGIVTEDDDFLNRF